MDDETGGRKWLRIDKTATKQLAIFRCSSLDVYGRNTFEANSHLYSSISDCVISRMEALESAPPRSLHQVHSVLLDQLARVRAQLGLLEKEFYGDCGGGAYQFICHWAPVAKEVMQCHSLTEVNSMRQVQSAIVLGRDPELRELQPGLKHISPETCARLTQLQNSLLSYVPSRFTVLLDSVSRAQALCDKYLLSFYTLDSRQAIDTAKKYTVNRRAWNGRVRDCVKNVLFNPHLFQRDCLRLSRMEKATLELLNRADIICAPFVGLFTDECEQLRAALDTLEEWISYDQGYASFVKTDMVELERRRTELRTQLTAQRHELHTSQYRTRSLQAEKARLQVELASLADREAELLLEEEQLYQAVNGAKIDCEIKEFRREEIKRAAREERAAGGAAAEDWDDDGLEPEVAALLLKDLKEQLRLLRHEIPLMERRRLALRSKLEVIEDKHRRHRETSEVLAVSEKETMRLRNEVSDASYQLELCQKCLDLCAQIYKLKTSSDTPEKIFHGMPLETKAVQEATTQRMLQQQKAVVAAAGSLSSRSDAAAAAKGPAAGAGESSGAAAAAAESGGTPFDKMCLLVTRAIERDWKRLYRALPFVPQRGRETIDKDIEELQANFIGESLFQCAWRAVQRWRRFHRRAKLAELRGALQRVRRADLVAQIDAFLAPPTLAVAKETPLPAHIDKDLVPFYRQIERYDNLLQMRQSRETATK